MKIEHLAIWTRDLEMVKDFYLKYFNMTSGEKYTNSKEQFSSYFLSFEGSSTRIEIMNRPGFGEFNDCHASLGLTHFSISVGNKDSVNSLTEKLRSDGYKVIREPLLTGDGYYESVIEDCEGNWVEIAI
jgi:lactoylglutathione lyase